MNNLIVVAIVLALIAALFDHLFGIKDPWRKIIYAGVVIIFVLGIVLLFFPGLFSGRL